MNMHRNAKITPAGRIDLVERVLIEKQTVKEVSRALRVSRRTVYKWVRCFQAEGVRGLEDRWAYARAYRNSSARAAMLHGFLNRYNRRRPHRGIGNVTPLSRLEALV